MNPFKEPQPRKPSIQEEHEAKQKGVFPPYARLGNEARWDGRSEKAHADIEEASAHTPITVVPDYSPFELRKAALEAALGLGLEPNRHGELFWHNLQTFENYLRDGTKPS